MFNFTLINVCVAVLPMRIRQTHAVQLPGRHRLQHTHAHLRLAGQRRQEGVQTIVKLNFI